MQGQRTVVLLAVLVMAVVGVGLWFGLDHEGGLERDESAAADSKETETRGNGDLPPPPEGGSSEVGTGGLAGRVLLLAGSVPVKDVMIRLAASEGEIQKTVTGPEGHFLFRGVPAGDSYDLSLSHGEYAPVTRPGLAVIRGEVTDVGVLHLERAVRFVVEVTDGGGAPIPSATVEIHPWRGGNRRYSADSWMEYALAATRVPTPVRSQTSGEDGRSEFVGLPGGYYSIVAEAEGYARRSVNRMIAPEDEGITVTVRLGVGFSLAGTVIDREGAPVEGRILATPGNMGWGRDEALRRTGDIDEEGRYLLARLPPGALSLSVIPEGAPPVPAGAVEIPRMKTFDIRLGEVATLVGRVADQAGEPVSGAEVRAVVSSTTARGSSGTVAVTDEEGAYRIDGVPPGYLSMVQVLAEGYAPYPGPLDQVTYLYLSPQAVVRCDVSLQRGARLTGKVLSARDKAPIPGARVSAIGRAQRRNVPVSATSGPDGTYTFEALSPGEYSLVVTADGFYQARETGTSSRGFPGMPGQNFGPRWRVKIEETTPVTTKDLVLDEGGVVKGVVVTSTGAPVANAQVRASRSNSPGSTTTRADGTFEVKGLAPSEKLSVYAWQPGRVARSDTFALDSGQVVTGIRLVLQAAARVSGVVEIEGGGHPAGAMVRAQAKGENRWGWGGGTSAPVGADGSFVLEEVAPGNLVVVSTTPGYPAGTSDELTVGEGADVTGVRVLVPRGLTLTGEVSSGDGTPVVGAGISISGGPSRGFSRNRRGTLVAQTDAGGRFEIDGLDAGSYRVTAMKEGYSSVTKSGVDPSTGELLRITFEEAGAITGRVVDESGTPVGGMTIGVSKGGANRGASTNFKHRGTSSEDGTFRISGVAEGDWVVSALPSWGSGKNYTIGSVEGVSPGSDPIEIKVRPGLAITGTVTDPEGAPLVSLTVYVRRPDTRFYSGAQTKADGGFAILGLEPGTYTLTVQSRTPGVASENLDKVSAGTSGLVIRLKTALTISGRVTDQAGAPLRSVSVRANAVDGSKPFSRSGSTQANGTFKVSGLPPGAYDISFTANGRYVPAKVPNIPAGSSGIEVLMDPGLTLSGTLLLPGGGTAGGVSLAAKLKSGSQINTKSDEKGKFTFRGLGKGKYQITVTRSVTGHTLLKPYAAEAGRQDLKIALVEGLSIRGMVVGPQGQGIPSAWVGFSSGGRGGVRADASGNFSILGLSPGLFKLRAYGAGKSSKPIEARAGDQAVLIRIE